MKPKILSLFVPILFFIGTASAEGISSAKDLVSFAAAANAGEDLNRWADRDGVVCLTADIDMSKVKDFVSIEQFDGIFDGCGHSLRNWKAASGLFGLVAERAVVRNLVIDASCSMKCADNGREPFYAGFIADVNRGTLERCVNYGEISHRSGRSMFSNYVGGVCGMNAYVMIYCENYGTVSSGGSFGGTRDNRDAGIYLGGVVGGSAERSLPCAFLGYCRNEGKVSYSGAFPNSYIGGVVGNNVRARAKFCVNRGNLVVAAKSADDADIRSYLIIGGICGQSKGDVVCCDNFGEVFSRSDIFTCIGGICGSAHFALTVGDCVNYGVVVTTSRSGGSVGGIVGQTARAMVAVQCFNKGTVKFAGESPNVRTAVGGIIGNAFAKRDSKYAVVVTECVNEGAINCAAGENFNNNVRGMHTGGICGFIGGNEIVSAAVRYCRNTGEVVAGTGRVGGIAAFSTYNDIEECANEGSVSGNTFVSGGICGIFEGGIVADCTNTAAVTSGGRGNAAGIVGSTMGAMPTAVTGCRNCGVIRGRFGFAASILAEGRNETDKVDGCGIGGGVGTPSQAVEAVPAVTAENYKYHIVGRNAERNRATVDGDKPSFYWNGNE